MIEFSTEFSEVAKSFVAAQKEFRVIGKDSKGYGYDYADLSAFIGMITDILGKHGLCQMSDVETITVDGEDFVKAKTLLLHESGQWIRSDSITMSIDYSNKKMGKAQAVGSIMTYARRYSLTAFLGLTSTKDDTDAAKIQGGEQKQKQVQEAPQTFQAIQPHFEKIAKIFEANQISKDHRKAICKFLLEKKPALDWDYIAMLVVNQEKDLIDAAELKIEKDESSRENIFPVEVEEKEVENDS